jgi:colanic acid biosynthesis glycosyl transferase WcaI
MSTLKERRKISMQILMLAQYFPPDPGGSTTRAYNAARGLVLNGCKVTVITSFPHYPDGKIPDRYKNKFIAREKIDGVDVIRTWIPSLPHSSYAKRLILHFTFITLASLCIFSIKRADVIFAMNPSLFCAFAAFWYKIRFNRPVIRNVDDLWPEVFYDLGVVKSRSLKKLIDFVSKISYSVSSAITPLSCGYVDTLTTKYRIPIEKITVIEHGVDIRKFHMAVNSIKESTDKKVVIYSGAINAGYDFEVLIMAAKLLEHRDVQFLIRGFGDYVDNVKAMIQKANVKNVRFSSTMLEPDDLLKLLSKADIFVLPMSSAKSVDRGLPTKLLEYQALGKPIVCISAGEAGRYILNTKSGLVTKERNPEVVAQLIAELADNDELCRTLGANGIKNVKTNLTLEQIGQRFLEVIDQIVKK